MPRKGPAYAITPGWRDRVLERIGEMKISQNELARRARISKASMSDALADGAVQTTVMPQIHKVLGWDPPPTGFAPDALELLALYTQMSERDQGALVERARQDVANRKANPGRRKNT